MLCFITAAAEKPASHKYEVANGIKICRALNAKRIYAGYKLATSLQCQNDALVGNVWLKA